MHTIFPVPVKAKAFAGHRRKTRGGRVSVPGRFIAGSMNLDDNILFDGIRSGDLEAFETLFRKYYSLLCSAAYRYLHDHDSSEEIVQELFYRLWLNRDKICVSTSVRSYLLKAVYFNSVNLIRGRKKEMPVDESILRPGLATGDAGEALQMEELSAVIEASLEELPEKGRLIFTMNRFEGLRYREIAEKLSVSVKTVEAYMGRALKVFRKNIGEYMGN